MDTDELVWVEIGQRYDVALTKGVAKSFKNAKAKARARITRNMEIYADKGSEGLPPEAFRHEGRFPMGGRKGGRCAIYAFKGWQTRIYGSTRSILDKPTFIGTEIDLKKKQDTADQALLRRAARKFGELTR